MGTKLTCPIFLVFVLGFVLMPISNAAQWNIDFQGDGNHNNTYGQTGPVDYTEWGVYWNIFEVPALRAPWPTNYTTNPSMDLVDDEGNFGVGKSSLGKSSLVKFSIVGDAYGWAGGPGADPLTGDYLIILNSFGVTNDPLTWRIIGLAPSTTYRLTYYIANVFGRGINFVANGVETTVSVPGLSVASALVTTGWVGRITGTADSDGYAEGNWSALTISTVAATATNPHPANGATDVPLDVVLGWVPPDYAVTHDVYFGTSSPPAFIGNLAVNSYDPGTLEPGTTYYWKIDEFEADGTTKHTGDVWSFTTQHIFVPVPVPIRCEASNPDPADGATKVPLDVVLSWTPGSIWPFEGTRFQDVYFGTNLGDVNNADTKTAGVYKGRQPLKNTSYDPGGLESSKEYYWRIDMVNVTGWVATVLCKGDLWSFTTKAKQEPDNGDLVKYPDVTAGLAWSPWTGPGNEALMWTPTRVLRHQRFSNEADKVTANGSSISNVQGIVWDPWAGAGNEALIWTPTQVFRHQQFFNEASKLTVGGGSISNVRGIVWDPQASVGNEALIWTPTQVLRHQQFSNEANKVTANGSSISNVQGVACSPWSSIPVSEALIWTPSKVFRRQQFSEDADQVTANGSSISNVRGIVWDPWSGAGNEALIWTPTQVFRHIRYDPSSNAEEVTVGGGSISNVQGIVWDPQARVGNEALIWTPTKVFWHKQFFNEANEVTVGGSSISNVQSIVWSSWSSIPVSEALIWTPTKVFRRQQFSEDADEVTVDGSSIFSYDQTRVSTVQVVVHHEGGKVFVVDDFAGVVVLFVGCSGAGIVGTPASTPVAYTGAAPSAVVVPSFASSAPPSSHSTVLGAGPYADTAMILGPEPVAGVVAGNSMRLFGFYSSIPIPIVETKTWGF